MHPVRMLLLLVGLALSLRTQAQWRLIYQSKDIVATASDTTRFFTSIESRGTLSKYLIVRSDDRQKSLVLKDAVWGYVDGNNGVWRTYEKECFLLVRYNGGWAEYVVNRLVSSGSSRTFMQPMYSRTLDSRIYASWQEAMRDVPPSFILK